jgi:nitrous oxidase accessory protein
LEQNLASAYDNASHNFWNASFGNYYSDYSGLDNDGDDIGDTPYWIPKGDSCVADWHPLVEPCNCSTIEPEAIKGNLRSYATYIPEDDTPYRIENDMIVISSKPPERWQF